MSRDHGRRGPQNIDALQMLRAVAALLVVMWHSRLSIMHANNNYWVEGDFLYRASHYPAFHHEPLDS
jgi:peptidoglycan/LPS O-acetylase OafA/YrhL